MAMRLKSLLNILEGALFAAAINQVSPTVTGLATNVIKKDNISLVEEKKKEHFVSKDFSQVEFLCVAHSAMNNAIENVETWRDPVCEDTARATKSMYDFLVKKAGREELVDKVRLVFGEIEMNKKDYLHVWLEIEMPSGNKRYFESTEYTPHIGSKEGLEFFCDTSAHIFNPDWKEVYVIAKQSGSVIYPTLDSLLLPGGAIRFIYNFISNFEDYKESFNIHWDYINRKLVEMESGFFKGLVPKR